MGNADPGPAAIKLLYTLDFQNAYFLLELAHSHTLDCYGASGNPSLLNPLKEDITLYGAVVELILLQYFDQGCGPVMICLGSDSESGSDF
jgi:hypothetical protein